MFCNLFDVSIQKDKMILLGLQCGFSKHCHFQYLLGFTVMTSIYFLIYETAQKQISQYRYFK